MISNRKSIPRVIFKMDKAYSATSQSGRVIKYLKQTYGGSIDVAIINLLAIVCMPAVLDGEGATAEKVEREIERSRTRFEAHMVASTTGAAGNVGDSSDKDVDVFGVEDDDKEN
jgi:anti-sigma factor RsiW